MSSYSFPHTSQAAAPCKARLKTNGKSQQFLTAASAKRSVTSRGLSSQPEEEDDEDKESSSTSGVFKGLASSSLLSGKHEPPRLDWSPEDVQQYFGDMDADRCARCNACFKNKAGKLCDKCTSIEGSSRPLLLTRCPQCDESLPSDNRLQCDSCHWLQDSTMCSHCGHRGSECFCEVMSSSRRGSKYRRRRHDDGIGSDMNSEVGVGSSGYANSVLSSPKRIGPNRVVVPVTVHMVDSL